ncbi:unnamed protein product [Gulo gulo]|uniref:Uncharacterized protein n=1 Tax=Gulo gulo TaxID=48420 RepID=A0A9X9MED8_GULGU|nr:unnamed protein product [Gulo gulo]
MHSATEGMGSVFLVSVSIWLSWSPARRPETLPVRPQRRLQRLRLESHLNLFTGTDRKKITDSGHLIEDFSDQICQIWTKYSPVQNTVVFPVGAR